VADDELTLDEIEAIEAQPDPQPRRRTTSKSEGLTRDIMGWLRASHKNHDPETGNPVSCTVPAHDESDRPRTKGMVVKIGEHWVCRICFLNQRDLNG
jgi:hypothetical protein